MQAMDQGAIGGATDGSREMDQGAIEGAMDGASNGSESNRRSDGWFERWIMEQ